MKCESEYCNNELIEASEHIWDKDWIDDPKNEDKYYPMDFMGKKLCRKCYSLEWY